MTSDWTGVNVRCCDSVQSYAARGDHTAPPPPLQSRERLQGKRPRPREDILMGCQAAPRSGARPPGRTQHGLTCLTMGTPAGRGLARRPRSLRGLTGSERTPSVFLRPILTGAIAYVTTSPVPLCGASHTPRGEGRIPHKPKLKGAQGSQGPLLKWHGLPREHRAKFNNGGSGDTATQAKLPRGHL